MTAIWHDLECGSYAEDLPFWLALAQRTGGPVLDVGAGTGRTTLALARAGNAVTAVDLDDELLCALRERARGLEVTAVAADARELRLEAEFALCILPMQTIQLLGGAAGRIALLSAARRHLADRGLLAIAIADELEPFELVDGEPGPLPDVAEIDGVLYSSRPVAVRLDRDGHTLERRREVVTAAGELTAEQNLVHLDRLDAATLEREARAAGLAPAGRSPIPPTEEYVGSTVVMLRG